MSSSAVGRAGERTSYPNSASWAGGRGFDLSDTSNTRVPHPLRTLPKVRSEEFQIVLWKRVEEARPSFGWGDQKRRAGMLALHERSGA